MTIKIKFITFAFLIIKTIKTNKAMKIRHLILTIFALAIIVSSCGQKVPSNINLENNLDSVSYALGADVGNSLKNANCETLDYEAFIKGLDDRLTGKEIKVKDEMIRELINKYFTELRNKSITKNLEEGQKFLEENKKRDGVVTTESGLQYEILTEGTGKQPTDSSIVVTHYRGTLIDGTQFDSSYDRGNPAEFPLNGVIRGWTEGLQLMKEGGKYKFYIPTELGYGMNVRAGGKIQPNMALIFEVELIEVKSNPKN